MIPEAFKKFNQFIIWTGKKVPVHPVTLQPSNPHDPGIHLTADQALQYAAQGHNIGFVFTKHDPFFFLDIDNCLTTDNTWSDTATALCQQFHGNYIEVSQSGTGLHIFGSGVYPEHSCKNNQYGIELYTDNRFVALTGTSATGDASIINQPAIDHLISTYFPASAIIPDADWTDKPVPEWNGIIDDQELINKFLQSKSAASIMGNRASIQDLWNCNTDTLSKYYPPIGEGLFDHSVADAALCQHLAFWTGKDCRRIDRLIRLSGLYREKWEKREKYRQSTILRAIGQCSKVYGENRSPGSVSGPMPGSVSSPIPGSVSGQTPGQVPAEPSGPTEPGELREGFQYLSLTHQLDLFKGCTYVRENHSIFTPDGGILKPDQFKAVYGGYVFSMDTVNGKDTTNAWQAFTESQGVKFPKVHGTCFRPEIEPGEIIEEENQLLVNTYVPINVIKTQGDVTPFLNHLHAMVPDDTDREILLSYMSACVQYPGIKFQWCPVVQGTYGNGKTFFISAIAYAVGHRYTHTVNPSDLAGNGSKFNAWIQNKLFISIEEIQVGNKLEILEVLKPMITNRKIEIQAKGSNQIMGDNRANFYMCTNFKDGMHKSVDERRYAIFFTAQQSLEDIKSIGWYKTGYFPALYDWAKSGGYANIAYYLQNYEIPAQFNPSGLCDRAPDTSSTMEAIAVSMGGIEQEILESIAEETPGFCGGWVSSMAFQKLLEKRRDNKRISHNKRKEILNNLGYVYHPGLRNGRVNNVIPMDGGKPRLFIKKGHVLSNLPTPADTTRHYIDAQGWGEPDTGIDRLIKKRG